MKLTTAISIKNPFGRVIGRVKGLTTMVSSLAVLVRGKSRVDAVYDESMDALQDWKEKERQRLDKFEEAVQNRFEAIDVDSHEIGDRQISGFMGTVCCSSDAKRLIDEINLAFKAQVETADKSLNMIWQTKDASTDTLK